MQEGEQRDNDRIPHDLSGMRVATSQGTEYGGETEKLFCLSSLIVMRCKNGKTALLDHVGC